MLSHTTLTPMASDRGCLAWIGWQHANFVQHVTALSYRNFLHTPNVFSPSNCESLRLDMGGFLPNQLGDNICIEALTNSEWPRIFRCRSHVINLVNPSTAHYRRQRVQRIRQEAYRIEPLEPLYHTQQGQIE